MHILKIKAAYCKRNSPKHTPPSHTNPDYTPYKYFCPALRLFTKKHMTNWREKKILGFFNLKLNLTAKVCAMHCVLVHNAHCFSLPVVDYKELQ